MAKVRVHCPNCGFGIEFKVPGSRSNLTYDLDATPLKSKALLHGQMQVCKNCSTRVRVHISVVASVRTRGRI